MRELGKRSPLIALLLLVALLSAVGVYQSKVSRLNGELKAQKHALETARIELSQQTVRTSPWSTFQDSSTVLLEASEMILIYKPNTDGLPYEESFIAGNCAESDLKTAAYVQRMGEHSRELAAQRQRDSDRMRHDLDNANRRAKIAEDDNVQKQAVIAHNNKQVQAPVLLEQSVPKDKIRAWAIWEWS